MTLFTRSASSGVQAGEDVRMCAADCWMALAKDWAGAMAFDPPVSEAQRRAMYAAAEGKSTLGIPEKVGREFVGKDGWVTVKPNGPNAKGSHIFVGEGGEVKAGMGGKFNGKNTKDIGNKTPISASQRTSTLEKNEVQSLREYASAGYRDINSELRSGKISPETKKEVASIDAAMKKSKISSPITVYRGISGDIAKTIAEGSTFREPAYMSTSTNKDSADVFSHGNDRALLEIKVPAGSRAIDMNGISGFGSGEVASENEILLDRGGQLKIVGTRIEKKRVPQPGNFPTRTITKKIYIAEYVGSNSTAMDAQPDIAAGIVYTAPSGKVLLLKRADSEENYGEHWALPGGKGDAGETPVDAAIRESNEEIGRVPDNLDVIDETETPTGMIFTTFRSEVDDEFEPALNDEHSEFGWFSPGDLPEPMHPAVAGILRGFNGAQDSMIAFDRASLRSYDRDGRLHVDPVPISKANVCPYYGREIPGWQELGLDGDRVYKLLRDPKELEKAADSFNNLPLLSEHVPVTADAPRKELVIGSTGTDAEWKAPYLMNSLVAWDGGAIKGVESGDKKQLSCAYHYKADMTPGTYEGERYDGVMRDIEGNHVALVFEGRAGPDVVVGDSKENSMKKTPLLSRKAALMQGAALSFLLPKLAADAKIDITPAFVGVTAGNARAKIPGIVSGIEKAVEGKLAKDASPEGLAVLLEALGEEKPLEAKDAEEAGESDKGVFGPEPEEYEEEKEEPGEAEDPVAAVKAFLAGKLSDEDMVKLDQLVSAIGEAGEAHEKEEMAGEDEEPDIKDEKKKDDEKMVTPAAMDAAIATAVKAAELKAIRTQREIRDAEKAVRPYVGELAVACDSADGVYRAALKVLGYAEADKVHASALPSILALMPKPGARAPYSEARIAADSAAVDDYAKMFPDTARIGRA